MKKVVIVQKYGGTSVATPERIKYLAKKIKETKNGVLPCDKELFNEKSENEDIEIDLVVVVSAMAGKTNELIELAYSVSKNPPQRELDMLLTTGERVTMALMAMALEEESVPAISFTGSQSGILTDTFHTKAKIVEVKGFRIKDELEKGKVVIVAGFQGVSSDKEITTLGRGGSDTTAVALSVYLNADICEIYTDVDGLYTADPRIVPEAKFIKSCCFDEMMEIAFLGAKVLHYRSVEIASRFNIPIVIRSSFTFNGGTIVNNNKYIEDVIIRVITQDRDIAKISIYSIANVKNATARILSAIGKANISIKLTIQSHTIDEKNISIVVSRSEIQKAVDSIKEAISEIPTQNIIINDKLARISVIGYGMSDSYGIQGRIFSCLADKNIIIDEISSSNISISFLIDENELDTAIKSLHTELEDLM